MAYKLFPLHNIEAAVGKGCPNRADDVILVQGLLDLCFGSVAIDRVQKTCKELGGPSPKRKIAVDGVYTEDIASYVEMMQRYFKKTGGRCFVDGKVTPIPREHGWFDVSTASPDGREYFLSILNSTAIEKDANAFLALAGRIGVKFTFGTKNAGMIVV